MKRIYVAGPISANDPITLFGEEDCPDFEPKGALRALMEIFKEEK